MKEVKRPQKPLGAVLGGRSTEPINSLFDGKGFIWKLEEFSAAAVSFLSSQIPSCRDFHSS